MLWSKTLVEFIKGLPLPVPPVAQAESVCKAVGTNKLQLSYRIYQTHLYAVKFTNATHVWSCVPWGRELSRFNPLISSAVSSGTWLFEHTGMSRSHFILVYPPRLCRTRWETRCPEGSNDCPTDAHAVSSVSHPRSNATTLVTAK